MVIFSLSQVSEALRLALFLLLLGSLRVQRLQVPLEDVTHEDAQAIARDRDGVRVPVGETPVLWPDVTAS